MIAENQDLFRKCRVYEDAKRIQALGVYPYFRPIEASQGSYVTTHGKARVMIGSNNYLGFTHHPVVQEAAQKAIEAFGTGCTGSRFLNGNLILHEELEEKLAQFLRKEACLVFSTGFFSNQGSLSALVGKSDVIYSDRENHASIIEGTQIALGDTLRFQHNNMAELERLLETTRHEYQGALIVADGVFSMSGDIFLLDQAAVLAKKYDCRLYMDDAHSLGVLGEQGRGTASHFGLEEEVDLIMGTFSKSFASIGGFLAGPKDVIHYVKHKARPFMFSAAMPPAAVATVLACLKLLQEEPQHLENLWTNVAYMRTHLNEMGYDTLGSQTPIIPLLIEEDLKTFQFAQQLYERGIFATPVVRPAVPEGKALLRTSYMATHSRQELDYVLAVLKDLGEQFGILSGKKQRGVQLTDEAQPSPTVCAAP